MAESSNGLDVWIHLFLGSNCIAFVLVMAFMADPSIMSCVRLVVVFLGAACHTCAVVCQVVLDYVQEDEEEEGGDEQTSGLVLISRLIVVNIYTSNGNIRGIMKMGGKA